MNRRDEEEARDFVEAKRIDLGGKVYLFDLVKKVRAD
jgi:hypothetical protein